MPVLASKYRKGKEPTWFFSTKHAIFYYLFMTKKFPIHPTNAERICWGCDKFCATNDMACSNERSPHPSELFGEDWLAWGEKQLAPADMLKKSTLTLEIHTVK